jgi:hypothetical protein
MHLSLKTFMAAVASERSRGIIALSPSGNISSVAVFHPQWSSGGNLDFPDGHQLRWRCTNFWGSHWAFVHADNRPSILFHHHEGILKASAKLEIDPADTSLPDLPLLVVLGWYLIILTAEDAAAVIVSSAVVS